MDRPGEFLVGQIVHVAERQQMLERPRKHVGLLGQRTGNVLRIVPLVRMNDSADLMLSWSMQWSVAVACRQWSVRRLRLTQPLTSHYTSYTIFPCFCAREICSVAYRPASTNSTHDARTAASLEAFTSKAFSQAGGTRFRRSA